MKIRNIQGKLDITQMKLRDRNMNIVNNLQHELNKKEQTILSLKETVKKEQIANEIKFYNTKLKEILNLKRNETNKNLKKGNHHISLRHKEYKNSETDLNDKKLQIIDDTLEYSEKSLYRNLKQHRNIITSNPKKDIDNIFKNIIREYLVLIP